MKKFLISIMCMVNLFASAQGIIIHEKNDNKTSYKTTDVERIEFNQDVTESTSSAYATKQELKEGLDTKADKSEITTLLNRIETLEKALSDLKSIITVPTEKCECGEDCHGTKCSAPCADDCKCTIAYENVMTIDGKRFAIETVETEIYDKKVKLEFGNTTHRIYCMVDFYGTYIPIGNRIALYRLEVEDEAEHKLGGGAYDGTAYADVLQNGKVYTVIVNNQRIYDSENKTYHTVSLSYNFK